ncbi:MAG: lipid IV(A) 4-amino-4-deoxy-L-arabinosyltransferase [Polaromonas sp.]|nr:lipid IV(A) 4-amino-4-deoxy-L-arabinosyltransferase [Polaromonas sp.]
MKRYAYPALLAAFALFFLVPLGLHGLWIPDETRYAQIAQGMLHSGDWVSPRFLGLRYFEKPVAGYWLIAISQAVFGENLFGARFASALVTLLSTLLVFSIARCLWQNPRKSWAATLLYMSFALIAAQAGYSNFDPQLTLWVNLSLVAMWFALDSQSRGARLAWWALLGFACAMGFMTKGFLAWLLPVIIALPYALWHGRLRELLVHGPVAVIVAILVSLPWVLAVHLREPDFWNFFFWNEHIRRFASHDAQHAESFWFYVPVLLVASLPWAVLIFPALRKTWELRRARKSSFLLLWFAMPFLLFSISKGKMPSYILPCFAPLALMMAHALVEALEHGRLQALRINGGLNLAIGVGALLGLTWLQLLKPAYHDETSSVIMIAFACLVWAVCGALQMLRPDRLWAAPALALWLLVALAPAALPKDLVNSKTPDQFIGQHEAALRNSRYLVSNDIGTAAALAWRLGRADIYLLEAEGELKYGLTYPDAGGRSIRHGDFQAWLAKARLQGSIGVALRTNSAGDSTGDLALMPRDATVYRENRLVIVLISRSAQ